MEICEKDSPMITAGTEPSDEAFRSLIKELLFYNEALKCEFFQIDRDCSTSER